MAEIWKLCFVIISINTWNYVSVFGCEEQADIMFLLDNSGSIGKTNFTNVVNFAKDFPGTDFKVGPYYFQLGVISYHMIVQHEFALNKFPDATSFRKAVGDIKYHSGSTRTDIAINRMYNSSFLADNGARRNTKKICLLFTDGDYKNIDETRHAAAEAKKSGVLLITIGVGKELNEAELKKIASDTDDDVFTFELSDSFRTTLIQRICAVSRPKPPSNCSSTADIVFVLDSSGSVRPHNFRLMLSFIKQFFKSFPIGDDSYLFGVQTFAFDTHIEFNLDKYKDIGSMMNATDKIEYTGGWTATAEALELVHKEMFKSVNGDRSSASNIAILITDGRAKDRDLAKYQATNVKKARIKLFVIGIGSKINWKEIEEMASDLDHVLNVTNFSNLQENADVLIKKVCKDT